MHIHVTNFNGNPNVGLFGIVTSTHVLIGKEVPHGQDEMIGKVFKLPVERITIAGTSLLNVFCLWTGSKLLVPGLIFDQERKVLDDLGIPYEVVKTDLTCLGNNILLGPNGAILNPDFKEKEAQALAKILGVPCERRTVMEIEAVGALGVIHGLRGLFHRDIPQKLVDHLESFLGITVELGTVNLGNPYIKSGILLGQNGFLIGDTSGGPEITNADEALGFI
jgi:translation initiation factor 6